MPRKKALDYSKNSPSEVFARLTQALPRYGLSLTSPFDGKIYSFDEDTTRIVVSLEWIEDHLRERRSTLLQLWFTIDTDILIRYRPENEILVTEYKLDGLTSKEKEAAISLAFDLFLQSVAESSGRLFVADPRGDYEDVDWDGFASSFGDPCRLTFAPAILAMPSEDEQPLHPRADIVGHVGGLVVTCGDAEWCEVARRCLRKGA